MATRRPCRWRCCCADRHAVIADRRGGSALCNRAGTDRIARRTGRNRAFTFGQRAGIAARFRLCLEETRGAVGGAGHRVQLRLVHRIGGFAAGGNAGDLPLVAGTAHRHAVGAHRFEFVPSATLLAPRAVA
jgi:hypothetical protein